MLRRGRESMGLVNILFSCVEKEESVVTYNMPVSLRQSIVRRGSAVRAA